MPPPTPPPLRSLSLQVPAEHPAINRQSLHVLATLQIFINSTFLQLAKCAHKKKIHLQEVCQYFSISPCIFSWHCPVQANNIISNLREILNGIVCTFCKDCLQHRISPNKIIANSTIFKTKILKNTWLPLVVRLSLKHLEFFQMFYTSPPLTQLL